MPEKPPTRTYQINAVGTVTDEDGHTSELSIEDVVSAKSLKDAKQKAEQRIGAQVPPGGKWEGKIQARDTEKVRALRDSGIGRAKEKDGQ